VDHTNQFLPQNNSFHNSIQEFNTKEQESSNLQRRFSEGAKPVLRIKCEDNCLDASLHTSTRRFSDAEFSTSSIDLGVHW